MLAEICLLKQVNSCIAIALDQRPFGAFQQKIITVYTGCYRGRLDSKI